MLKQQIMESLGDYDEEKTVQEIVCEALDAVAEGADVDDVKEELQDILESNRFEMCPEGSKRVGKKCVRLTPEQKRAKLLAAKKRLKVNKLDNIKKSRLTCPDGESKVKVNGKWKCMQTKECPKGSRFIASLKKCVKTAVPK